MPTDLGSNATLTPVPKMPFDATPAQFVRNNPMINNNIILICGHYKGIDERVIDEYVTDQFSVGDFVMTSGEIPALIILDSISRLIPGALNNLESVLDDSFSHQLLDHPHYTNPRKFRNRSVPEVLLNGNHRHIDQ